MGKTEKECGERLTVSGIHYRLVRSRRRTVSLIVRNSKVVVRAPMQFPVSKIEQFVEEKSDWLKSKQQQQAERRQKVATAWSYGRLLPLLDRELQLIPDSSLKRGVRCEERTLRVPPLAGEELAAVIRRWYVEEARRWLGEEVPVQAARLGVKAGRISVRTMRSRWGSCSSRGDLSFNWRLMEQRVEVARYVVIHELCHIRHLNHSDLFWNLVAQYDPHFLEHRGRLRAVSLAV